MTRSRVERVVLVHGAATTARVRGTVVPVLDGFEVVIPDRPGRPAGHGSGRYR